MIIGAQREMILESQLICSMGIILPEEHCQSMIEKNVAL